MKLNLTKLALTAGLGLGIISFASVAEAGITLNGSSLTGQKTEKQLPQQLLGIMIDGSRLGGQSLLEVWIQPQQNVGVEQRVRLLKI